MKRILKIITSIFLAFGLFSLWYWVDKNDYFQTDYRELTTEQTNIFEWQNGDSEETLKERFKAHFTDSTFLFPRQKVHKIKIFKSIPLFGVFTGKTLKQEENSKFIKFWNDPTNFGWGETTWSHNECNYYFRFYNSNNKVIGKIFLLLDEHSAITDEKPLCPSMKFGTLSRVGFNKITELINNNANWE